MASLASPSVPLLTLCHSLVKASEDLSTHHREIAKLSTNELRLELARRGLPFLGNRMQLVQRMLTTTIATKNREKSQA